MAGMGRIPSGRTRQPNRDQFAAYAVTVHEEDRADAPELPGWERYGTETLRWYNTWTSSPQAAVFTPTDWQRLHMLAALVDAYWRAPSVGLMSEIRLNESLLGATSVDRVRGRISIDRKPKQPVTVSAEDRQRRRLRLAEGS